MTTDSLRPSDLLVQRDVFTNDVYRLDEVVGGFAHATRARVGGPGSERGIEGLRVADDPGFQFTADDPDGPGGSTMALAQGSQALLDDPAIP